MDVAGDAKRRVLHLHPRDGVRGAIVRRPQLVVASPSALGRRHRRSQRRRGHEPDVRGAFLAEDRRADGRVLDDPAVDGAARGDARLERGLHAQDLSRRHLFDTSRVQPRVADDGRGGVPAERVGGELVRVVSVLQLLPANQTREEALHRVHARVQSV